MQLRRQQVEFVQDQQGTTTANTADAGGGQHRNGLDPGDWIALNNRFTFAHMDQAITFRFANNAAAGLDPRARRRPPGLADGPGRGDLHAARHRRQQRRSPTSAATSPTPVSGSRRLYLVFRQADGRSRDRLRKPQLGRVHRPRHPAVTRRRTMGNDHSISRRKFLGAAAGAAGAAALGSWAPRAFGGPGNGVGERLVPPGKLGVQHFSIRDAITRRSIASSTAAGIAPTMGRLGGPNFPDDPTDLGPLVPLPGGFIEVFEYLASVGYRGFEFFQFTQNVNELGRQPTHRGDPLLPRQRWAACRSAPTRAASARWSTRRRVNAQIEIAHTLGHTMIGTAGDPVGGAAANLLANWEVAANNYNLVGAALAEEGLRYYLHPEQNNFNFFNDPAHPELSRVHRLDWFVANTDPSLAWLEPDILHSYAGRARFRDPVDGSLWGAPLDFWKENSKRILAWHVKDGSRLVPPPAAGVNPFTQVLQRTPTFQDAILVRRGLDRPGLPRGPGPRRRRLQEDLRRGRREGLALLHRRDRQRPGPGGGPRALAAPRQVQPAEHARPARRREGAGQEHRGRRGDLRERLGRGRRLTCDCAPSSSPASRRPWAPRRRRTGTAIRPGTTSRRIRCIPSIAARGSQAIELQLLGVLQAAQRDGYPVKVAIVGSETDVEENPGMLPAAPALRRAARRRPRGRAAGHGAGAGGDAARHRGCGPRDGRRHLRTGHAGAGARAARAARRPPAGGRRRAGGAGDRRGAAGRTGRRPRAAGRRAARQAARARAVTRRRWRRFHPGVATRRRVRRCIPARVARLRAAHPRPLAPRRPVIT